MSHSKYFKKDEKSCLPRFVFVGTADAVGAEACVRAEGETGDSLGKREAGERGEGEGTKEEYREGDDAVSHSLHNWQWVHAQSGTRGSCMVCTVPCRQFIPYPLWRLGTQENRKRETRQLAAQVVRREEEMTENHLGDNESEGDAPDDDDDLDEV